MPFNACAYVFMCLIHRWYFQYIYLCACARFPRSPSHSFMNKKQQQQQINRYTSEKKENRIWSKYMIRIELKIFVYNSTVHIHNFCIFYVHVNDFHMLFLHVVWARSTVIETECANIVMIFTMITLKNGIHTHGFARSGVGLVVVSAV